MRGSLALTIAAVLSITASACGTSKATHSESSAIATAAQNTRSVATVPRGYLNDDGDEDFDDMPHYNGHPPDDDLKLLASYGPKASSEETRAIASVIKRYYTASLAGNGTVACSLLSSSLASGLASTQSQAGQGGAGACAGKISPLLKQQHAHLLSENVATMRVASVHAKGGTGLAVLQFKTAPESELALEREGRVWKVNALFDTDLT